MSKMFPFGLAVIALLPALIQLAIAAIAPADFEVIAAGGLLRLRRRSSWRCSAPWPRRSSSGATSASARSPLYFSRALSRVDYASAKVGGTDVALMPRARLPQLVLLLGNGVAAEDLIGYLEDNVDSCPPIVASGSWSRSSWARVSLAIACQTSRRAFATGAVIASSSS